MDNTPLPITPTVDERPKEPCPVVNHVARHKEPWDNGISFGCTACGMVLVD